MFSGLVGAVNLVTVLELYYVLMMMGSCGLGFQEHPEDGRLILQRWKELKNSKLETGFAFAQP